MESVYFDSKERIDSIYDEMKSRIESNCNVRVVHSTDTMIDIIHKDCEKLNSVNRLLEKNKHFLARC